MKKHIVFGGIHIESTTFTSYISDEKDFLVTKGDALLNRYPWLQTKDYNVICTPLVHARAIPGGVVSKTFFNIWLHDFMTLLKDAMNMQPVDGVLFDIHGAMSVEGMNDPEGVVARRIREVVGKEVVISTSMDLHGNVSDLLFQSSDLLTCYRTAPHIDQIETRKRAFENLLVLLERPKGFIRAKVDVPILLPGEKTATDVDPGKTLYGKLNSICKNKEIIDASIWMGFPWADQERCHSVIVITGTNEEVVRNEIEELSTYFWNIRHKFAFVGPTTNVNDAYKEAVSCNERPFFISDTGDNPGAGGSGDINNMLREAISLFDELKGKNILFSSIFDFETISKIYSNAKKKFYPILLGGKIDTQFGEPLKLEVEVKYLFTDDTAGKCALVNYKNIDIIITEKRFQYGTIKAFQDAGIGNPSIYDIIVVKMGYLEPELKEISKGWVMALSNGAVNQDLQSINYKVRSRPLYPFEDFEFIKKVKII